MLTKKEKKKIQELLNEVSLRMEIIAEIRNKYNKKYENASDDYLKSEKGDQLTELAGNLDEIFDSLENLEGDINDLLNQD